MVSASSMVSGDGQAAALGFELATLSLLLGASLAGHGLLALLALWELSLHVPSLPAAAPVLAEGCASSPTSCQSCWLHRWPQPPRGPCWARWVAGCSPSWPGSSASRSPSCCSEWVSSAILTAWPAGGALPCWCVSPGHWHWPGPSYPCWKTVQTRSTCHVPWSRGLMAPQTLGFLLLFSMMLGATHLVYLHLHFFIRDHCKMWPVCLVPTVTTTGPSTAQCHKPSSCQLDSGVWPWTYATRARGCPDGEAWLWQASPARAGGVQD